jgi:hypothetical protein
MRAQVESYFFTSASKAFDYWPSELEGERCLWGVRTGDGVAGTVWAAHHACISSCFEDFFYKLQRI